MNFKMLATDYDRTLAEDGVVDPDTILALESIKSRDWLLCLVTGRELEDLRSVFSRLDLFDIAVVENGAVLYVPSTHEVVDLGVLPPTQFLDALHTHGIKYSSGRVIVAAHSTHARQIDSLISELGVKLETILNRDSVMILPAGVNKASGIEKAAERLNLSLSEIVSVGDGENDVEFVRLSGLGVAVANALDEVKAAAKLVLTKPAGAGVVELINDHLLC